MCIVRTGQIKAGGKTEIGNEMFQKSPTVSVLLASAPDNATVAREVTTAEATTAANVGMATRRVVSARLGAAPTGSIISTPLRMKATYTCTYQ